MKSRILIIITAVVLMQGCSTTLKLDPVASKGQQEIYQDGMETLLSVSEKTTVAIRPASNTYLSEHRPSLVVSVQNNTDEQLVFSTENIMVHVNDVLAKVFTYDELVAEIKRKQAWAAVAAALNGAAQSMNAANAGYTYNSGTYNSSYYGNNGYSGYSGYGSGSYSGYSYNAAAVQQAQAAANAQTQKNMEVIRNNTSAALNELGSTILKKNSVFPGQIFGGYIQIDKIPTPRESINEVNVVVSILGEEHKFYFEHSKVSQ